MIKKLKYVLILIFLIIIGLCTKSQARITTSDPTVSSGETVTININSQEGVASGAIDISSTGGLTFVSASGGVVNGTKIAFAGTENKTSGIATYTFKAPNVESTTTYKVVFNSLDMTDADGNSISPSSATATVTVKGTGSESNTGSGSNSGSSNNTGSGQNNNSSSGNSGSSGNSSSSTPSFTSVNETVYATGSVNVRQSWSTSSPVVGSLSEGQSVTRTGKGDNGWSRVTFNGSTAYISSEYLTTEKPEEKSNNSALKELTLLQGTLSPEFSKEVKEYTVQVGKDVTELQLDAIPEDEKAKASVEGNTDLKDGENKVTITVTAEDGSTTVYTLTVNKTDEASTGLTLNKLEITGATLSPTFTPEVYSYTVNVPTGTTSLDITAETSEEDATVEITGNTDLKDGENLITIMVKKGEEEEQQVATYQITVNVGEQAVATTTNDDSGPNILVIICGVAAAIIVIAIIILVIIHRKNSMDYDDEDDEDDDYENTTILNQNFNYADELKARRAEKDEEKKQSREDYLNSYKDVVGNNNDGSDDDEDDDTTKKKRRGRHF